MVLPAPARRHWLISEGAASCKVSGRGSTPGLSFRIAAE